jgi:hypothetical protein
VTGRGLCGAHYWQQSKGQELRPVRRRAANGAGTTTEQGYRRVYAPEHPNAQANGTILEHVLVMSRHLDRPLRKGENVHHKNGVRDDNRLENLELWVTKQPLGQRVEDLVAWAREILETYEEEANREALGLDGYGSLPSNGSREVYSG